MGAEKRLAEGTSSGVITMLTEFQKFIAKGNVMDMAVGIIIGAAFTAIVKSMVDDLLNPIIGAIFGGVDFTNYFVVLGEGEFASLEAAREAGAAAFAYGAFLTAVINFLIIAFVVFLLVKNVNRIKEAMEKKEEPAPAADPGPSEKDILIQIRDSLAERSA
jgi:large conductance mechanosensitive channel